MGKKIELTVVDESTVNKKLTFGKANAKLKQLEKKLNKKLATFSLPSGYACPGAKDCLSKADKEMGKIKDGKNTKFRCFQASGESRFPTLRKMVWDNFEALKSSKTEEDMVGLIERNLPKNADLLRIHIGGDYYNRTYFRAWMAVARKNPTKTFYSYTKSVDLLVELMKEIPPNLVLTASRGGKFDYLIDKHKLKCAEVVFSEEEAKNKGLEIDHDDSHALGDKSFALLVHGIQPPGSEAGKAVKALDGVGSYSAKSLSLI